jgi:hypothetical protein
VQSAALNVRQIVTLVIGHQIDGRPFRQGGRLIEDQSPVLDARSKRAHAATVRLSLTPGKRSGRSGVTSDWRSEDEIRFPTSVLEASSESQGTLRVQPGDEHSPCPECLQNAGRTERNREDASGRSRGVNALGFKRLSQKSRAITNLEKPLIGFDPRSPLH